MTHRQPQRELNPHGGLNYFYGGISSEFPLTNHLALPGSESVFGIYLLCVPAHLLGKMDSTEEAYG